MKRYKLYEEQWIPASIEETWSFFSSPENLAVITPPDLNFKVLTKYNGKIYEGMEIDYIVSPLFKFPMRWRSRIDKVIELNCFTDSQLIGPYSLWEHTHTFTKKDNGVLMTDEVTYSLPLGFIGRIMHWLLVRKKLKQIFAFRRKIINQIFKEHVASVV